MDADFGVKRVYGLRRSEGDEDRWRSGELPEDCAQNHNFGRVNEDAEGSGSVYSKMG